jgi:glutamate synthase (ferredoxin)
VLLARPPGLDGAGFERLLYLTRKRIEARLRDLALGRAYVPSFSSRTIVYKGLMVPDQLSVFYRDLADPDYRTQLAVFHQRYSTNTMPRWSLAQPFRFLAHNGEINTLQGNVNFMRSREPVLESSLFGEHVHDLLPIIEPGGSDSAALDNAFELLTQAGRDPLHALAMLVPEAYEERDDVDPDLRAFYDYHATLMEPWDGPAALALSDGRFAIAGLDRNGLRPQRYWITEKGLVIVGSEAGLVDIDERVVEKGRLGPGLGPGGRHLHRPRADQRRRQARPRHAAAVPVLGRGLPGRRAASSPPTRSPSRGWERGALTRTQALFGYSQRGLRPDLRADGVRGRHPGGIDGRRHAAWRCSRSSRSRSTATSSSASHR